MVIFPRFLSLPSASTLSGDLFEVETGLIRVPFLWVRGKINTHTMVFTGGEKLCIFSALFEYNDKLDACLRFGSATSSWWIEAHSLEVPAWSDCEDQHASSCELCSNPSESHIWFEPSAEDYDACVDGSIWKEVVCSQTKLLHDVL